MTETYKFGNGVVLRRREMLDIQVQRYTAPGNPNLHEPVEEEGLLKVLNSYGWTDPVFLDVGAAVGYYSILVKKKWPEATVIAVELLPEHIEALHCNASLNSLQSQDIMLLPIAVATKDTVLFLDRKSFSSGLVEQAKPNTIEVQGKRLEGFLKELPPVNVMKMDIQGLEFEVLEASKSVLKEKLIGSIILGTHGPKVFGDTNQLLKDMGYDILFSDPKPPFQPDGLIVATVSGASSI